MGNQDKSTFLSHGTSYGCRPQCDVHHKIEYTHTHMSPSNEHGMSSQITGSQLSNAKQLNKMWLAVARRDGEVKSRRRLAALLSGRKHRSGEPFGSFSSGGRELLNALSLALPLRSSLYSNNYYLLKCDDNVDFQATDESEKPIV